LQLNHINKYNKNILNHYTMKKLFAIVALIAAMSFAGKAQAQIIAYLGYAPENFITKNGSISQTEHYQGIFLGGAYNYELPFMSNLGVAGGLQFRLNMGSYTTKGITGLTEYKFFKTQTLLDIPILVNYRIDVNRDIAVTPFIGPMFSIALSGNTHVKHYLTETTVQEWDDKWYQSNNMGRFNIYGVFGAAANYNQYGVFLGYRFGFLDLETSLDYVTLSTSGFFIGASYSF